MTARVTTSDTPSYLAAPGNPEYQAYFGQAYNASDSSSAIPGASTAKSVMIPGAQGAGRSLQDRFCLPAGNQCIADLEFFLIENFTSYWGQPQSIQYGAVLSL